MVGAMVIRDNSGIRRFWRKITHSGGQMLVWIGYAICFSAGSAPATPYAQPGQEFQRHQWSVRPMIRAGYEPSPYADRHVHARRWEPEAVPYIHQPAVSYGKPDCVEEHRPVVRTHAVHETIVREPETYEEPCGIKCWFYRLRAGYCGRGCDYYRFRMTQFPEGWLGGDRVRVACR
jgi:hypothetical protein